MTFLDSVDTRSSKNRSPKENTADLDSSDKGIRVFGIASGNSAPAFEVQKSIFYQMPEFVKILVILSLLFAISFRWNDDLHAGSHSLFD